MNKILSYRRVGEFVDKIFSTDVHGKRRASVTNAVFGLVLGADLGISCIGRVLAASLAKAPKHAVKQVDRLVGNHLLVAEWAAERFARWLCATRASLVVSLDWTIYDRDGHHPLALNLVTRHGRATPLLWKSYRSDQLKGRRSGYERAMLRRLKRIVGPTCVVTVLADRGFANQSLFTLIHKRLKWHYVIRLRKDMTMRCADGLPLPLFCVRLHRDRPRTFRAVQLTGKRASCATLVMVKASNAKEPWYLASSLEADARTLTALYARRFTCEEQFRDVKDPRLGIGLEQTTVGCCERRDRLLLPHAFATVLLTLVGAAGEKLGYDRKPRANTVKKRTHSLFRQGREYMKGVIPSFVVPFRRTFETMLDQLVRTTEVHAIC